MIKGYLVGTIDHPSEHSNKMTNKQRLAKLRFDEETIIIRLRVCARHKVDKSTLAMKERAQYELTTVRNLIRTLEEEIHNKEDKEGDQMSQMSSKKVCLNSQDL